MNCFTVGREAFLCCFQEKPFTYNLFTLFILQLMVCVLCMVVVMPMLLVSIILEVTIANVMWDIQEMGLCAMVRYC